MGGNFLTSEQVRKLEKLPTKKELITAIAVMVKKVRARFMIPHISQSTCCKSSLVVGVCIIVRRIQM